jgi:hypothetical protein
MKREDVHKEPFTFRIQTFIAIGKEVAGGSPGVQNASEVQSICGILNNIMAFRKGGNTLALKAAD